MKNSTSKRSKRASLVISEMFNSIIPEVSSLRYCCSKGQFYWHVHMAPNFS